MCGTITQKLNKDRQTILRNYKVQAKSPGYATFGPERELLETLKNTQKM